MTRLARYIVCYANEMAVSPSLSPTLTADVELAHDVRIAVMRLARRLRSERPESGLTLTQLAALATVERHGPVTPGELAAHERVSPPSMTRVIAALERNNLLIRTAHPTDGRQSLISLSDAGEALLAADRSRREAWLGRQLGALGADQRAAVHAALPVLERLAEA